MNVQLTGLKRERRNHSATLQLVFSATFSYVFLEAF